MEHWPSGSHLVMKTITPDHHVTLYVIGYKYNKKNVTVFIFTENAGTTECGEPYTAKWNDDFGARQTRKIDRPDVISQYFKIANVIDIHNQSRQGVLALEEHWVTKDAWFRICTTFLGITVTDAFYAVKYALKMEHKISIKQFAGWLAQECIYNGLSSDAETESYIPIAESVKDAFSNLYGLSLVGTGRF